jgi:hypothetical protein
MNTAAARKSLPLTCLNPLLLVNSFASFLQQKGEMEPKKQQLISVNYKFPSTTIIFPVASPMMLPRNQPKAGE